MTVEAECVALHAVRAPGLTLKGGAPTVKLPLPQ